MFRSRFNPQTRVSLEVSTSKSCFARGFQGKCSYNVNMCVCVCFSVQIDVSGPGSYRGLLEVGCDANGRPFGADFVYRRIGFNCVFAFCAQARWFYGCSRVLELLLCTAAWVLIVFLRFGVTFVYRRVGFKGVLAFRSGFCARAR